MKKKQTLLEFLKNLKSYEPAFRDKSSKTGIIKIKCYDQLSSKDYKAVIEVWERNKKDIVSITNTFVWKQQVPAYYGGGKMYQECFVIKLKKAPSEIILK